MTATGFSALLLAAAELLADAEGLVEALSLADGLVDTEADEVVEGEHATNAAPIAATARAVARRREPLRRDVFMVKTGERSKGAFTMAVSGGDWGRR